MCNIAGYVGSKRAAPILLEMIKKQEGFDGGFYTGIATLHEGKIYYAKLTGDTDKLIKETNAANLPGTIGIVHSRTQSGGDDAWAHPFVNDKNGAPTIAYVANGFTGAFKERNDEYTSLTQQLLDAGYTMHSRVKIENPRYQILSDGTAVHMSDAMCQLIARNIDNGENETQAIENAFCEMPSEIVGLLLSLGDPNAITYSRINMPMFVGFCKHGAYLASTPSAFLGDESEPIPLPACSSGRVSATELKITPYNTAPAYIEPITAKIRSQAYVAVSKFLCDGEKTFPEIRSQAVAPLFKNTACLPSALLTYAIVNDLDKEAKLNIRTETVAGEGENTAPKYFISLK